MEELKLWLKFSKQYPNPTGAPNNNNMGENNGNVSAQESAFKDFMQT
jgi:hypothetical protein